MKFVKVVRTKNNMEQSKRFSFNAYDIYSVARDFFLLALSAFIANIDLVRLQLEEWGTNPLTTAIVIFILIELGRKYLKSK